MNSECKNHVIEEVGGRQDISGAHTDKENGKRNLSQVPISRDPSVILSYASQS